MKMISSTSMTSTRGTTLISASETFTRRRRLARVGAALGIVWTLGIGGGLGVRALREIPLGDVQKLHRKIVHLRRHLLHAVRQVVVEDERWNGSEESERRRDQRFRNRRPHRGDTRRPRHADLLEGD